MKGIIKNRDKLALNMKMLSALGLEKNVMKELGGDQKETDPYHSALAPLPHRKGTLWIQNRYNGILVDRVIRLYETMFGDITNDMPMQPSELYALATSYLTIYPHDNMSATRIHHLVKVIKSGASVRSTVINVEDAGCTSCGKRYHIHAKMTRKCLGCELEKEAKSDPAIYDEIRKTIYVDGGNLKNTPPKQLKLKPSVLKILALSRQIELEKTKVKQFKI